MRWNRVHRLVAATLFVYAAILYVLTLSPSVALWDPGEFIASAYGLQVMHPPGAPVYLLLGRLFALFASPAGVATAVNLVSALAAAGTVMLAYLIVVRLVHTWQRCERGERTPAQWMAAVGGGLVGALALAGSDSFWFNAVEAEVYALSLFFLALIVWVGMRWHAAASPSERERFVHPSNRYLVLIAYLFGLAIGIHLMGVLAFFFVGLLVYFKWFDGAGNDRLRRVRRFLLAGVVMCLVFLVIYPGVVIMLPELAGRSGVPGLFVVGVAMATVAAIVLTRRRLPLAHLALMCLATMMIGYASYALIPIRSATDPAIDLNDPETAAKLVPYLKREQYGQTPLLLGHTFDDQIGRLDSSREALFPRRYSWDPGHQALYAQYTSDFDYFWRYQLGHMYVRYFLWNFVGRASDVQDAPSITGVEHPADAPYLYQTPSEKESRNAYFALPLLLGLFGMMVHFRRDPRRALALLALFFITGVGLVIYLNEIPSTPRERDYIYVGSYFAFTLWMGIGGAGLLEGMLAWARRPSRGRRLAVVLGSLLLAAIPLRMTMQDYDDHDRSGNTLGRDFAYNLLMSVDHDAILFTGGDNDTYPLWYLQAVEGVRRDVYVVNLSLLDTPWYARQLKHEAAYEAAPLPVSLTDEQIDQLGAMRWTPRTLELPVDTDALVQQTELEIAVQDTNGFESPMRWRVEGRTLGQDVQALYPSDVVILNVLQAVARQDWTRPVYFAATSSPSSWLGLDPYFQREGLAYRIVPIRHDDPQGRVVPRLMADRLARFRFDNLNDPDVHYDSVARGLAGTHYRMTFQHAADTLVQQGRPEAARRLMATLMDAVPPDTIPLYVFQAIPMAQTYLDLGDRDTTRQIMRIVEPRALNDLTTAHTRLDVRRALSGVQAVQLAYLEARAFDDASRLSNRLADILGDESLRLSADELRERYGA